MTVILDHHLSGAKTTRAKPLCILSIKFLVEAIAGIRSKKPVVKIQSALPRREGYSIHCAPPVQEPLN